MGNIRKPRKTYSTPKHPWEKARIDEEKALRKEFGFRNKKELWKVSSKLKNYFDRSKGYVAKETTQSVIEQEQMLNKLRSYGLLSIEASLGDVLSITLKDMLERRLQTVLFRKGLARSVKQARQFIVHGHVMIGEQKITSPSYMVTLKEEDALVFSAGSSLSDEEHPERALVQVAVVEEKVSEKVEAKEE